MTDDRVEGSIDDMEIRALIAQIHACTYCLITETGDKAGTAVAVQIGSRHFLATAAHVLQQLDQFRVVLRAPLAGVDGFAAQHVHAELDVGLLEIDPSDVSRFNHFVPADRIGVRADQEAEYDVIVLGYPTRLRFKVDERQISESETLSVSLCNAFTFSSFALCHSDWPSSTAITPPVLGVDLFIGFQPQNSLHFLDSSKPCVRSEKIDSEAPHPGGVSGCGIWVLSAATPNRVWQPRAYLHGIQSKYSEDGEWLRGTMMAAWLDLVEVNYPDLEADIQAIRKQPTPMGEA